MDAPWPYNIEDAATAIHYAMDKDCGYRNLLNCLNISHRTILRTIEEYEKWKEYHEAEGKN